MFYTAPVWHTGASNQMLLFTKLAAIRDLLLRRRNAELRLYSTEELLSFLHEREPSLTPEALTLRFLQDLSIDEIAILTSVRKKA